MDTLNLSQTQRAIGFSIRAGRPLGIVGMPGIGKTAIAEAIATSLGYPFEVLTGSGMSPEDLSIPVADHATKSAEAYLYGAIARLVAQGRGVLLIDEATDVARAVWAPLQSLINERRIGGRKIPDGITFILAMNDPAISTGGQELSMPVRGRITFVRCVPEVSEVQNYFRTILGAEAGALGDLAVDFAETLDVAPQILELDPPSDAIAGNSGWGAPRSYERAFRMIAPMIEDGADAADPVLRALVIGSVGGSAGTSYLAIQSLKGKLPKVPEIIADPARAKLPDVQTFAASVGILAQVAKRDAGAAWIYAGRMAPEHRIVACHTLQRYPVKPGSPHATGAQRARITMEAEISKLKRIA